MVKVHDSNLNGLASKLARIPDMTTLINQEYSVLIEEEHAAAQIAALVKKNREFAGLTQEALGKKVGITQARISQMERGDAPIGLSVALLARVAAACDRTLQLSFGIATADETDQNRAAV